MKTLTLLEQLEAGFEPNSVAANHRLAGARIALRYAAAALRANRDLDQGMSETEFLDVLVERL